MSNFRKGYFSIDGNPEPDNVFEGYTDGTTWNGWACVTFTKEQMETWLKASPYNYCYLPVHHPLNNFKVPVFLIFFEEEQTMPSTQLMIEPGAFVEAYCMDSYCFVEMLKKINDDHYEPLW